MEIMKTKAVRELSNLQLDRRELELLLSTCRGALRDLDSMLDADKVHIYGMDVIGERYAFVTKLERAIKDRLNETVEEG